jgi:hypothetical protein
MHVRQNAFPDQFKTLISLNNTGLSRSRPTKISRVLTSQESDIEFAEFYPSDFIRIARILIPLTIDSLTAMTTRLTNVQSMVGQGLIEVSVIAPLIGTSVAERLTLGYKGAGGLAWSSISIFGAIHVTKGFCGITFRPVSGVSGIKKQRR